jgi:hypothetical protein
MNVKYKFWLFLDLLGERQYFGDWGMLCEILGSPFQELATVGGARAKKHWFILTGLTYFMLRSL